MQLEGVVIRDEDFRLFQLAAHVFGDDIESAVVVAGLVGKQDAEAIANGDAGGDDQEGIGEFVKRLPGDDHGHDDSFARTCRHLEGNAVEERIGHVVGGFEFGANP